MARWAVTAGGSRSAGSSFSRSAPTFERDRRGRRSTLSRCLEVPTPRRAPTVAELASELDHPLELIEPLTERGERLQAQVGGGRRAEAVTSFVRTHQHHSRPAQPAQEEQDRAAERNQDGGTEQERETRSESQKASLVSIASISPTSSTTTFRLHNCGELRHVHWHAPTVRDPAALRRVACHPELHWFGCCWSCCTTNAALAEFSRMAQLRAPKTAALFGRDGAARLVDAGRAAARRGGGGEPERHGQRCRGTSRTTGACRAARAPGAAAVADAPRGGDGAAAAEGGRLGRRRERAAQQAPSSRPPRRRRGGGSPAPGEERSGGSSCPASSRPDGQQLRLREGAGEGRGAPRPRPPTRSIARRCSGSTPKQSPTAARRWSGCKWRPSPSSRSRRRRSSAAPPRSTCAPPTLSSGSRRRRQRDAAPATAAAAAARRRARGRRKASAPSRRRRRRRAPRQRRRRGLRRAATPAADWRARSETDGGGGVRRRRRRRHASRSASSPPSMSDIAWRYPGSSRRSSPTRASLAPSMMTMMTTTTRTSATLATTNLRRLPIGFTLRSGASRNEDLI